MPKAEVVVTSYESLCCDLSALRCMPWGLILLDDRGRGKSQLARARAALLDMQHCFRLLLTGAAT